MFVGPVARRDLRVDPRPRTLEDLAARLQHALASADADALKPLAVDECAWKRAQWLIGNDKAERLAKVARSDRRAKEHESARRWLDRANLKLPAVLEGVALERDKTGRARTTTQIVNEVLITTTVANSKVSIRNPTGNAAIFVTTSAGGSRAVSASLVIKQIR